MQRFKQILAAFLCLTLICGCLPMMALAQSEEQIIYQQDFSSADALSDWTHGEPKGDQTLALDEGALKMSFTSKIEGVSGTTTNFTVRNTNRQVSNGIFQLRGSFLRSHDRQFR